MEIGSTRILYKGILHCLPPIGRRRIHADKICCYSILFSGKYLWFNNAVGISDYTAQNGKMTDEMEKIWKYAVVIYFEVDTP
jgi:hypothetical protein